ncbi:hypothetical protein AAE478_008588 [Parahypoxylon ruwenzoriense]
MPAMSNGILMSQLRSMDEQDLENPLVVNVGRFLHPPHRRTERAVATKLQQRYRGVFHHQDSVSHTFKNVFAPINNEYLIMGREGDYPPKRNGDYRCYAVHNAYPTKRFLGIELTQIMSFPQTGDLLPGHNHDHAAEFHHPSLSEHSSYRGGVIESTHSFIVSDTARTFQPKEESLEKDITALRAQLAMLGLWNYSESGPFYLLPFV